MIGERNSTSRAIRTAILAGLISVFVGQTSAVTGGVLRGRVLDSTQAPIEGAQIEAVREGDTTPHSTLTSHNGEFTLSAAPGKWTLKASCNGFEDASQTVNLADGGSETREFVLKVAGSRQSVTVNESADYRITAVSSATKTLTPLRDLPQSVTVVPQELIKDQMMMSMGDVVRYVPGITSIQGENNRDQLVIRGTSTSADFFLNGVRDDVQYYRDLYNLDRVEALKGPNAMLFGRGGGGGVINRVTKEAGFAPLHEFTILGGSFGNKRFTADLDQRLSNRVALRLNGMYENSGSFRDFVNLERHGINPTITITPGPKTRFTVSYENVRDDRVSDRGIPSFQGKPVDVDTSTYYGNPQQSHVGARVNLGSIMMEHQSTRVTIRNRTMIGNYDRGYQNFVPGALSADAALVSLSAYNNATLRRNVFNQTDVIATASTGRLRHQIVVGTEVGLQLTNNFRNTGYFNNSATSILVPFANSVISTPTVFRQSATDADNHLQADIGAAYVQDQVDVSRKIQVVAGVRFDRFDLRFHNNRTNDTLRRVDNLVSPRAGVVYKLRPSVSLYGSYTVSELPSSGDQFSSLTTVTQQVKPEKFTNREVGVKWDAGQSLSFTLAAYRLDRTNTRSTDPNDPTRIVQTGSQRSNGFELGWNGSMTRRWRVAGGYAYQDVFVTSATTAARAGAQVAQAPHHAFSIWNSYQILPKLGAGLGVLYRAGMFAAFDDSVRLPGYSRVDAAVYYSVSERARVQVNMENLTGRKYFLNADSNTNISPGSPRAVRLGLIARF